MFIHTVPEKAAAVTMQESVRVLLYAIINVSRVCTVCLWQCWTHLGYTDSFIPINFLKFRNFYLILQPKNLVLGELSLVV